MQKKAAQFESYTHWSRRRHRMPIRTMVTSSRRANRVTNKTKLLIYRGSDKVDLSNAETIVWEHDATASSEGVKHQHVGAKGVESGELLVSRPRSFIRSYACGGCHGYGSRGNGRQRRVGIWRGTWEKEIEREAVLFRRGWGAGSNHPFHPLPTFLLSPFFVDDLPPDLVGVDCRGV